MAAVIRTRSSANNSTIGFTTVDGLRTDLAVAVTSDDVPEFIQNGSTVHFDILVTNTSAVAVDASNVVLFLGFRNAALADKTMPADWTFEFHTNAQPFGESIIVFTTR